MRFAFLAVLRSADFIIVLYRSFGIFYFHFAVVRKAYHGYIAFYGYFDGLAVLICSADKFALTVSYLRHIYTSLYKTVRSQFLLKELD